MAKAYFAGGCFWCVTPTFRRLPGVLHVTSGYCGGEEESPDYASVKAQRTGHRETVEVEYDPDRITYADLCEAFLRDVDPFDGGGQFIDRGASYTLAAFYTAEKEREIMAEKLRALEASESRPVFVALEPFRRFWIAEEEHQDFDLLHPDALAEELRVSGRVKQ